jgi:two-component system nitrogen regulation response regulator NtrX
MSRLRAEIARVASTDARVLITGENGTGKELVARSIHQASARAPRPLVEVNCAAIPEELIESELFGHVRGAFTGATEDRRGKFEEADGATLLLDEVGDMSARTQAKVLRALQEGRFTRVGGSKAIESDVRVLSATNKSLTEEIRRGSFREDLYFRLAVVPIAVPALRERSEDVPALARHFLAEAAANFGRRPKILTEAALSALVAYRWPGNVRELKNVIERAVLLGAGPVVQEQDIALERHRSGVGPAVDPLSLPAGGVRFGDLEREMVRQALVRAAGNQTKAGELLGMSRDQIRYRIQKFGFAK